MGSNRGFWDCGKSRFDPIYQSRFDPIYPRPHLSIANGQHGKCDRLFARLDSHFIISTLFVKRPRVFTIGRDIKTGRDVGRYVRWPRYVRIQRQRAILKQRLRTPPAVNQFSNTLDKSQASALFRLLAKYRPETRAEKKERLQKRAEDVAANKQLSADKKPRFVKFGLQHITSLIEKDRAKLVVIAHDVDPIELVMWLPALCRAKDVPYCIVKGKARLGMLVHQKTATALAVTDVRKEDQAALEQLIKTFRVKFNENTESHKKWGKHKLGVKASARLAIIERAKAKEMAQLASQ